jgi:hypothetical protein
MEVIFSSETSVDLPDDTLDPQSKNVACTWPDLTYTVERRLSKLISDKCSDNWIKFLSTMKTLL